MKSFIRKNYVTCLNVLLIIAASLFLTFYFLNLWGYDFHVPIYYGDGDLLFTSRLIKSLGEYGQYFSNPLMGAPFYATQYDFPLYGDAFNLGVLWLLYAILGNFGYVINAFYILLFPATAVVSYFVMRNIKIGHIISVLGSLTFTFLSYRFLRNQAHLFLANFTFVPLAVLILIWLFSDERLLRCDKDFFKYRRNYIAIISFVAIALSGIYYAFFMCFFLAVTVLVLFFKDKEHRKIRNLLKGIISLGTIGVSIMAAALPTFIQLWTNGKNAQSPVRSPLEAEVYGLKITQLFYPLKDHGITFLKDLMTRYSTAPLSNEGSEYLGFIGVLGFVLLLFLLFARFKKDNIFRSNFELLSKLNLSALLLATIGGFGSMFSYIISAQIRAYNRISVYIAYFSILALCMGISILISRINKPVLRCIALVCIIPVFLISIKEQTLPSVDHSAVLASYYSDDKFVKKIEASVGADGMIYQLPYFKFPEMPPLNKMGDYALTRGYLHSDTLRWSYGDYKGRSSDSWNESISAKPISELIRNISIAGFDGIYIDTYAYNKTGLKNLKTEIEAVLKEKPFASDDKRLLFYSLENYNTQLKSEYTQEEWDAEVQNIFLILTEWTDGFSPLEGAGNKETTWRWCSNEGTLILNSQSDDIKQVTIGFKVCSGYGEKSNLIVMGDTVNSTYQFNKDGAYITFVVDLQPGKNTIHFSTDAKKVVAPNDSRSLYMQFSDFICTSK